jgi:hypothetical protein
MVELEIRSTYAFSQNRWLGDVAPHLLTQDARDRLAAAKAAAMVREAAEARLPKDLLYTSGWPTRMPTREEAELIAEVRQTVSAAVGIQTGVLDAQSVMDRYAELLVAKAAKDAQTAIKEAKKAARKTKQEN